MVQPCGVMADSCALETFVGRITLFESFAMILRDGIVFLLSLVAFLPGFSDAPPKFAFLENGVGQNTAPSIDRPGDSALTGPEKGNSIDLKVTAKKGTTLRFICILHPWMQGKVLVR